ncbi:MAG: hypothetical protein KKH72_02965 [Alphaproteobacteria bacterium]|nr:hypothetical protein [Alphaproteobacteria bacterium]
MSRAALAHLAAAFGLGAGFAAGLAFAEVGWATLAFAAAIALAAVTTGLSVALARRLDHRVASRLGAIGAAVGHAEMQRGHEVDYVESIVSTLHQSLMRASAVRNGVAQSPLPIAVLTENGEIATASDGLLALGAQFERGSLFPDYEVLAVTGAGETIIGSRRYRVVLAGAEGTRRLVSLVPEQSGLDDSLAASIAEAMISGSADLALTERLKALGPPARPLLRGFEAIEDGLGLIDGVLDGDRRALAAAKGRNDALGARARAIADLIAAFGAGREEEDETRARLEDKLRRIADLVERHRAMAARLRDSAEGLRADGASLGVALDAGGARAAAAGKLGREAQVVIDEALDAARTNSDWAASIGALTLEISGLVAAIETVSFRTNLIALNASIEAARAGEKGAGFAVVADEVRTLAQTASKTAKQIRSLVARGRSESVDGAAGAAGLARLVEDLDGHLRNLSTETDRIADALGHGKGALAEIDRKAAAIAGDAERATGGVYPRKASNG